MIVVEARRYPSAPPDSPATTPVHNFNFLRNPMAARAAVFKGKGTKSRIRKCGVKGRSQTKLKEGKRHAHTIHCQHLHNLGTSRLVNCFGSTVSTTTLRGWWALTRTNPGLKSEPRLGNSGQIHMLHLPFIAKHGVSMSTSDCQTTILFAPTESNTRHPLPLNFWSSRRGLQMTPLCPKCAAKVNRHVSRTRRVKSTKPSA